MTSAAAIHAAAQGSFRKKMAAAAEAGVTFKEVEGAVGRKGSTSAPPTRPISKHVVFADEYEAMYEHVGGLQAANNHLTEGDISEVFPPGSTVFALYDYIAQNSDELSFAFDDGLTVQAKQRAAEPGWLTVRNDDGKEGIVPANYFEADDGSDDGGDDDGDGDGGGRSSAGAGAGGDGGEEVYHNDEYNTGYPSSTNF